MIDYAGVPSTVEVDGHKAAGAHLRRCLGGWEPEISAWWFPGNDHPRDEATFDVSVAVPDGTEVLSNGVNTGTSSVAGWITRDWRTTKPTAPYLVFMAPGSTKCTPRLARSAQPRVTAYSEGLGEKAGAAKASIERTPRSWSSWQVSSASTPSRCREAWYRRKG